MTDDIDNEDKHLLDRKESYIILFFLGKFGKKALIKLGYDSKTPLKHVHEVMPYMTSWGGGYKSVSGVQWQLDKRIKKETDKIRPDQLADEVFQDYNECDLDDFKRYVDKFLSIKNNKPLDIKENPMQDTNLLNEEEVITLLFLVSQFPDTTLTELNNNNNEASFFRLIISIKSFNIYDNKDTVRNIKNAITRYMNHLNKNENSNELQELYNDPQLTNDTKEICDNNKNKIFEDFQQLIGKVKFLKNHITATQIDKPPYNRIIYGAPGTGKSYLLNNEVKKHNLEHTRVTFYDGYTYGQFVGSYKPVPNGDSITYEYVAGPLMKSIVNSINDPSKNYCLIIEEINRARADKVFGNVFQLLDRNEQGESEYEIDLSDEQQIFLENHINIYDGEKLTIPKNLYIWATMNSADQGVYVLDSAFKRRWNFEHIGLNDNQDKFGESEKNYLVKYDKNKTTEWNHFRTTINNILMLNKVHEDKLLAPFFIKPTDFNEDSTLKDDVFIGKILMYLFDDILKHKSKNILFTSDIHTFSQLKDHYDKSDIFKPEIIEKLHKTEEN